MFCHQLWKENQTIAIIYLSTQAHSAISNYMTVLTVHDYRCKGMTSFDVI